MYKQNSEFKSVQKKLMAAVAMVLIASIMVVSSSYAWFTLSTAPEVTGITTSVGSNGNLEMALNTSGINAITTTESASTDPYTSNPFWGNLVNLSDSRYGLSQISLAPARPNLTKLDDSTKEYTVSVANTSTYTVDQHYLNDGNSAIKEINKGTVSYSVDGSTVSVEVDDTTNYAVGETIAVDSTDYTITAVQPGSVTYVVATSNYALNLGGGLYLLTAIYGTDGRVSKLEANGETATFNGTNFSGGEVNFGVRGVGTKSGLTAAEIALRNAKTVITDTKANTLYLARKSLQEDSVKLANILIANVLDASTKFTATDYNNIVSAIENLNKVVNGLEDAMQAVVVAVGVAQNQSFTADDVTITTTDITLSTGTVVWDDLTSLKTYLLQAAGVIASMRTDLQAATDELPTGDMPEGGYSFEQLSAPMYKIFSMDDLLVDGKAMSAYETEIDIGLAVMQGAPLTLVNGIYADIALFIENYDAQTSIHVKGNFSGIGAIDNNFDVTMTTDVKAPECGYYLPYYITALSTVTAAGSDSTTVTPISDLYAYIIDLGFRTNASGSYLQLQTDAANRVADSEHTMGKGSYMEFDITSTGYTQEQLLGLMSAIRVMFFDTTSGKIHGIAALDVGYTSVTFGTEENKIISTTKLEEGGSYTTTVDGVSVTYEIESVTNEVAPSGDTTTYSYDSVTVKDPHYSVDEDGTVKAMMYLYNYTVDTTGKITLSTEMDNDNLLALQQNTATAVSSMVYLDGDLVDNSDVGISGKTVEGKMNLQFSSSADLVPMEYTFTEDEDATTAPTVNATLATPTVSLSGKTVTVTAVDNATSYAVYIGTPDDTPDATLTNTLSVELTALNEGDVVYVVALGADNAYSLPGSATCSAAG